MLLNIFVFVLFVPFFAFGFMVLAHFLKFGITVFKEDSRIMGLVLISCAFSLDIWLAALVAYHYANTIGGSHI